MRAENAGFTLLEVMIAMSILAMALVAVLQMQSQNVSMSSDSRFRTMASLLAQSKMAEAEAAAALSNLDQSGDFSPEHPDYAWTLSVTDTRLSKLKKIEVHVYHKAAGPQNAYQLVLYKTSGV